MAKAGDNFRITQGPLYSRSELASAEAFLAADGFTQKTDDRELGARVYRGENGDTAVSYLDDLGCSPAFSGILLIAKGGQTEATTVWGYARDKDIAATSNPVARFVKRHFT